MTARRIQIYPSVQVPALEQRPEGIPFRWLESLVLSLRAHIADDEEQTCMVTGVEQLRAYYDHLLTPIEDAQARVDALSSTLDRIERMLPRQGEGLQMQAGDVDVLRELLRTRGG